MNIQGCNLRGCTLNAKILYNKVLGSVAPSLGATAAASWPPTGWISLQNASADNAFLTLNFLDFSDWTINSTSYGTFYVGSNSYITFGSGSTLFSSLSASNPALNKIMIGPADYSYQRVAYKNFIGATLVRFEGYNSAAGITPGSSNIIYEFMLMSPTRYFTGRSAFALRMGNAANTGSTLFGIYNTTTAYATTTLAQNTSYVFEADNNSGTAWTIYTGYNVTY
jgi:hypothetical protein